MWTTLSKILRNTLTILGLAMTLFGYLGEVIGWHVSQLAWIAIGNIACFVGLLWTNIKQREEIGELKDRLTPKFKILFEQSEPFEHIEKRDPDIIKKFFCVGVYNESDAITIDDVRVELERYIDYRESKTTECAIALRQADDIPSPDAEYRQQFTLHAKQTKYIDVVSRLEGQRVSRDEGITLCYAVRNAPNIIARRGHELHIRVSGRNVVPVTKQFTVDVTDDGRLGFELKESTA